MNLRPASRPQAAFTMVELAICLAIIGVGLVAIIGVLPLGMNVQRENREETIINQDATILMEAIRSGARGMDDLTNYVYAIYVTNLNVAGTLYLNPSLADKINISISANQSYFLTNGANIVGLLSTPEFVDNLFSPTNASGAAYTNRVVAYIRSLSGPAAEKPPQNNDIIVGDSFSYRVLFANLPVMVDPNVLSNTANIPAYKYSQALTANLRELRLSFQWPQLPNGNVGKGRQTFRTLVGGELQTVTNAGQRLYFFEPQSFVNPFASTNAP